MRSGARTAFACAVLLVGCFQTTGDGTELGDMETPTDRGRSPAGRCSLPSASDATIVAPLAAQARPSCAPDDGPAWSFEILQVPRTFSCEPLTDTRVRLEVFDELRGSTLPRTFEVGSGFGMNDGAAFLCEGSDCEPTVRGVIDVCLFDTAREGLLRYEIEMASGEVLTSEATIPIHCLRTGGGCG